jgi:hypothetical protein
MKKFLLHQKTKKIDKLSIVPSGKVRMVILLFALFLFENKLAHGQDCSITKIDCPPTFVNICADQTINNVFGTNVSWIEPKFRLDCSTSVPGEDYSFYIEFDLPEGKSTCWVYNYVQRIGSNDLRLWQSTGISGTNPYFIAPTQYFNNTNGTPVNMELIVGSGKSINWTLIVLDGNIEVYTQTISNITATGLQIITIPNTVSNGEYNLKFEFTGNGNNSCYIDRIYYDAVLSGDASCAEGINFSVSSDRNPGDFFPVGITPVTYTAVYTNSSGVTQTKTCPFNVVVDGIWGTASHVNPVCAGGTGSINFSMTSANTSINNLVYSLNGGTQIPLTGTTTTNVSTINGTTTSSINVNGTISNLSSGTYNWIVKDINSGCEKSGSVIIAQPNPISASATKDNDVSCFGGNNGKLTVSATGGTGTLTYSINGGTSYQASNVFSGLTTGTYTITVKDANNCTKNTNAVTITQPLTLIWSCPTTPVSCFNGNDGSATITFSGGTGPYSISINGSPFITQTSPAIYSNLSAGTYTKVLKDANGCIKSGTFTVNQPTAITASAAKDKDVSCNKGNDGKLTVTASGGTGPLSYSIDGGISYQVTGVFNSLTVNTYNWIVKDSNGCMKAGFTTINQPQELAMTVTPTQPTCFGQTGSVTLETTGGNAPYTYDPANPAITGLVAGSYTYKVTDANNCTDEVTVTINAAPDEVVLTVTPTQPTCFGQTGSVTLETTGGNAPYTYDPANPAITGLVAGNYTYKVTDANNCTDEVTVTINAAPDEVVLTVTPTQPTCFGQTGSVTLETTGGNAPYTYDPANPAITGLVAGNYTYKVTDANNCTDEVTVTINAAPDEVVLTVTPTQPTCFGQTGSVTLETTGGNAPYTYDPANPAITGLVAGSYTYKVTDANNCTDEVTVTINAAPDEVVLTVTPTQPTCFGQTGSVTLETTGGNAPYTYDPANPAITGLVAGSYTYKVTDANNCTDEVTVTINAAPDEVVLTVTPTQPTCFGQTGSVTLETTGGNAPYTYDPANPAITGLVAGSYTYKVTDANNCTDEVTVTINAAPDEVVLTVTPTQPTCFGQTGSVTLETTGGNAPYTYDPANPAITGLVAGSYTYKVTDANNCTDEVTVTINAAPDEVVLTVTPTQPTCFGQTGSVTLETTGGNAPYTYDPANPAITGLVAGNYTYKVTDANNCTDEVTVTINAAPDEVVLTVTPTQPTCFGQTGSVTLETTGGNAPYTYDPANPAITGLVAGSYTYKVTDANNCTDEVTVTINAAPDEVVLTVTPTQPTCFGQTGSVTLETTGGNAPYTYDPANPAITGLVAGSYTYKVTDANNCTDEVTVTINAAPDEVVLTVTPTQPTCFGQTGSVTLETTGGNAPYTYDPANPAITGLVAGNYTYKVTDANNCTDEVTVTINAAPDEVVLTVTPTQPTCFGQTGSVTLETTGGNAPYTYDPANPAITGLVAGSYTYKVTDANNCTDEVTVTINAAPDEVVLTVTPTQPTCFGQTGSVTLETTGGNAPYTYDPANPAITGLVAGSYTYKVTDANNCTDEVTVTINAAPDEVVLTVTPTQPTCFGQTGSVTLETTGGNAPYTYDPANPAITGLVAGSYTYKVTDANNCTDEVTVTINAAPDEVVLTVTPTQPTCFGQTGSVTLETTGGNAPYTYDPANPAITGLVAGSYTYKVTDANNCTDEVTVTINAAPDEVVLTVTPTQPTCFGQTGSVTLETTGGNAPYTYDPANPAITGLVAGSYTYKVTDANNCTDEVTVTINAAPDEVVLTVTPTQPTCFGQTGSVTLETTGGNAPYTYDPANPAITGLVAGSYTYKVTDANNCTDEVTVTINAAPDEVVLTVTPTQPTCFGQTGSVTLETTGGNAPYTYDPANPAITGLVAGSYTYKVTDANNCTDEVTVTINAAPDEVVLTVTPTQPTCFGQTGSVTLETTGGNAPYTYDPANPAITGLVAGNYTYKVTDANNCTDEVTVTINAAPDEVVLTVTPTQPTCFGQTGSVTLETTGGNAPYTYDPANPAITGLVAGSYTYKVTDANNCTDEVTVTINAAPDEVVLTVTPTQPTCFGQTGSVTLETTGGNAPYTYDPANPAITGLVAGSYTYKVTDANNCTDEVTVTINAAPDEVVLTVTPTQPTCFGQTGSVTLETTGGNAPYTYDPANPAITGLVAGNYTYKVTDANNCTDEVTVTINAAPDEVVLTVTPTQPTCFGQTGSVTLETTGGNAPYTYDPANPAITGLVAGSYTYKVTDANNCTDEVTVTINAAPDEVVLTVTPTQPTCFGQTGSVTLETTGGNAPYTYDPANPAITGLVAGSYTYKVTDANNCTDEVTVTINAAPDEVVLTVTPTQPTCFGQTGSVTLETTGGNAPYTYDPANPAITGLVAGNYTYKVTDANNCTDEVTVTINAAPDEVVLTVTPTQPTCFGQTGSVTLETTGGNAPYTYDPANPAITGLVAGSYTYKVTDANNCTDEVTVTINAAPDEVVLTVTPTQPTCFGQTGSVTLETTGGNAPYTYDPANPAITGLVAGNYTYKVTDANNCTDEVTVTINAAPDEVVLTVTPTQPTCFGQTGSVTLETTGGNAPYTYDPANPAITGLVAGSYTYKVTDANNCTDEVTVTINAAPDEVVLTVTPTQPTCFGQTGSVTLETTGGNAPYTYDPANPAITGLVAGSYTYKVTDANNCTDEVTVTINAAPDEVVLTVTPTQPTCFGQTGSVTLETTGGNAPYTYDPANPAITGLVAGSYTYKVTDANNCTDEVTVTINAAPDEVVLTVTPTQPTCFGQTGSVTLETTGGNAPYTYDPANPAITGLVAGSYTYKVTDANNCTDEVTVTINAAPDEVVLTVTPTQPTCFGQTGSVTLETTGGNAPYTYDPANPAITGLVAGNYTYKVTDANNCTDEVTVTINAAPDEVVLTVTPTQPTCFGQTGSVTLETTGGNAPYTYDPANPAITGLVAGSYTYKVTDANNCTDEVTVTINAAPDEVVLTVTPTQPTCFGQTGSVTLETTGGNAPYTYDPANPAITGLVAGSYTYKVTDANNCTDEVTVTINAAPDEVVLTVTPTQPTCFGQTGSVTLETTGGNAPYTYDPANPAITGLVAGSYTYKVTDANNCTDEVTVTINAAPDEVVLTVTPTQPTCFGQTGSVTLETTGGNAPYTYDPANPAITGLVAGSYTYKVTDANNCTDEVTVTINAAPDEVVLTVTPTQPTCFGQTGSVTLETTGGNAPYTYDPANPAITGLVAGNYTYKVTDANNCTDEVTVTINAAPDEVVLTVTPTQPTCFGQTGSVTLETTGGNAPYTYDPANPAITGLVAGSYTYKVTDANNCTDEVTVTINAAPDEVVLTVTPTQPTCFGQTGSVTLETTGGNAPYTYDPANPAITGLVAGSYTYKVTDANNCTDEVTVTINAAPDEVVLTVTPTQPTCFGQTGSVTLETTGGNAPYTYDPANPAITGLVAGNYTYKVTDANNCTDEVTVTINAAPDEVVLTVTPTQPTCFGQTGSVTLETTGGNAPYTYDPANPAITGLVAGSYTYKVTDANNCTDEVTVTINAAPDEVVLTVTPTQPTCFGQTGSVTLETTGGNAPYTYDPANPAITGLVAGSYTYKVTDANNCTDEVTVTINAAPDEVVLTVTPTQPTCFGQTGSVTLETTGGNAPYTYDPANPAITGLVAGSYTYKVTDANNCTDEVTVTINAAPDEVVLTVTPTQPTCFGQTGSVTLETTGGNAPYTYDPANPAITGLVAGSYTYKVTDANNCTDEVTVTINAAPDEVVLTVTPTQPTCFGQTGSVTLETTGGNAPYTYDPANPAITGLVAGSYTYKVTDANNCTDEVTVTINAAPDEVVLTVTPTQPTCFGQTGSVTLETTGGNAPYTYDPANPAITGLVAGSYTYKVTDANNCTDEVTVTINAAPDEVVLTVTPTQPTCFGQTGSVTLETTGGNAPYTYDPANPAITGLVAGSYTYKVTDANNCTDEVTVTINAAPDEVVLTVTPTQPTCFGQTGSVTLETTGGNAPYTYDPANPAITGLVAGSYTYKVTDANNCTDEVTVTINAAPDEVVLTVTPTQPTCFGQTGSVTLETTGGNAPYTYDPANPAITGLVAGSYTYKVTDANNCTDEVTVTINAAPDEVVLTVTPTQPTCFGQTGSVTLETTGGNAPYTYDPANPAITGLVAGSYTYKVTDANNCTDEVTVTINAAPDEVVLTVTPTQPTCFGQTGSVTLETTGGNAPYTYDPANPAITGLVAGSYTYKVTDANNCTDEVTVTINAAPDEVVLTVTPTQPTCFGQTGSVTLETTGGNAPYTYDPANPAITGLVAGSYTYKVTDANNCTDEVTVTINAAPDEVVLTVTPTQPTCFGQTGSVTLETTGGNAPYTYDPANPAITGLVAGSYTYKVTDANNCTDEVTVTINAAPDEVVLTVTPTQPTCFGQTGSVTLETTGGNAPYTYDPANPAITGLVAGSYTYKVTDANNCTDEVTVTINAAPDEVVLTVTPTQPTCFGQTGSVTLETTGGNAPYTYDPANPAITGLVAGNYTYKVTDANNCTDEVTVTINAAPDEVVLTVTPTQPTCFGQTGSVTLETTGGNAPYTYDPANPAITGLVAGSYTYKVTDANNCTDEVTVTINAAPDEVVLTVTPTQPTCFGQTGSVTLETTGGNAPYTYDPANPAITGLVAGNYTYKVTDANNCTDEVTVTINAAPDEVVLTVTPTQPTCFGQTGSVTLETTGGNAPYTYDPANPAITGLVAGNYTYKVTDANNCTDEVTVTINAAPDEVVLTVTPTQPTCFGQTGSVTLETTGGNAPYTYDPANPAITGLVAGNYTYKVTDANGCEDTEMVIINKPAASILSAVADEGTTNGYNGGIAVANVLSNDLLNEIPVLPSAITITVVSDPEDGVTLNTSTGAVTVDAGTPAGVYLITYQICEICENKNTTNCEQATVTVTVSSATIDAVADAGSANGYDGGTAVQDVLANDLLNGVQVVPADVNTSFVSSTNGGISLVGTSVVVAAGTPAGTYELVYQICEKLNPTNCDQATVTVTVSTVEMILVNDRDTTQLNTSVIVLVKNNDSGIPLGSTISAPVTTTLGGTIKINTDGSVTYTPPTDYVGEDKFVYTVTTPEGSKDSANVIITVTAPVELVIRAIDDEFETYVNETVDGNMIDNDINPIGDINIQQTPFTGPVHGTVVINPDGTFVYTPDTDFSGEDSFTYQICNSIVSTTCGIARVTITVQDTTSNDPAPFTPCDDFDVFIPNGFSPNDDIINDYFTVSLVCNDGDTFAPEFAEKYPNAKVEIFNRWGNMVYQKENFGNIDRWGAVLAWWDGSSNSGWTVGGDKLPAGTYFYILYFNDEEKEPKAGSVFLNR